MQLPTYPTSAATSPQQSLTKRNTDTTLHSSPACFCRIAAWPTACGLPYFPISAFSFSLLSSAPFASSHDTPYGTKGGCSNQQSLSAPNPEPRTRNPELSFSISAFSPLPPLCSLSDYPCRSSQPIQTPCYPILTNKDEWFIETNPINSAFVLIFGNLNAARGHMQLSWQSAVIRTYRVLIGSNITDATTVLTNGITSTPRTNTIAVGTDWPKQGYFRIEVE